MSNLPTEYKKGIVLRLKRFLKKIVMFFKRGKDIKQVEKKEYKTNSFFANSIQGELRKQEKINDIIELVEKNPNSLNYLSLDRLEKIDKMYDERINSNKKKIEELQSSIKFVEESIKRAV